MARCPGATCVCKINGDGTHLIVTGTGTQQDPFVLTSDFAVTAGDTSAIDMGIAGSGTSADPYVISALFSPLSQLQDIGNVNAPAPTNGYVLAWNSASNTWEPQAPTTAPAGAVTTGSGLSGDGSGGSPLDVEVDPAGGLTVGGSGVGLTTTTKQGLVQRFVNISDRTANDPTPDLNAVTMLDTGPGSPEFWDGSAWKPLIIVDDYLHLGNEFSQISGAYTGSPVTVVSKNSTGVTDGSGQLVLLTSPDIGGFAGVLSVNATPLTAGMSVSLSAVSDTVVGTFTDIATAAPATGVTVTASVTAMCY